MRVLVTSLIAMFSSLLAFSQNWQAVYPNENFEYQSVSNPDSTLSIYFDDEMENNVVGDGRFFGILYEALCEPSPFTNCTDECYKMKFPFLQRGLTYLADGMVEFQYPDTFRIATLANIGEEWVFGSDASGAETIAEISAVVDTLVLGEADSVKVISLNGLPAIYLTKNHGIMGWYVGGTDFELTAIPGRNLNGSQLTTADIFNFEVGDVLAYWTHNFSWANYDGISSSSHRGLSRVEITDVEMTDALITIQYEMSYASLSNNDPYQAPWNNVLGSGIFTAEATIDLNRETHLVGLPIGMVHHNGATRIYFIEPFLPFAYPTIPYSEIQSASTPVEVHSMEINDRQFMGYGIKEQIFSNLDTMDLYNMVTSLSEISDFTVVESIEGCSWGIMAGDTSVLMHRNPVTYMESSPKVWDEEYYSVMEGLGFTSVLIAYNGIGWYGNKSSILLGYEKNGIQVGYIPDLLELSTLNVADKDREDLIKVFPNPNNGQFTVALPDGIPLRSWSILDGTGRKLQLGNIPTAANQIDLELALPAGIYLLNLEGMDGRQFTRRVQIIN